MSAPGSETAAPEGVLKHHMTELFHLTHLVRLRAEEESLCLLSHRCGVCVCESQRSASNVLPRSPTTLFFEIKSFIGLALTKEVGWLASEAHRPTSLHFSTAGTLRVEHHHYHIQLATWLLGIELRFLCLLSKYSTSLSAEPSNPDLCICTAHPKHVIKPYISIYCLCLACD